MRQSARQYAGWAAAFRQYWVPDPAPAEPSKPSSLAAAAARGEVSWFPIGMNPQWVRLAPAIANGSLELPRASARSIPLSFLGSTDKSMRTDRIAAVGLPPTLRRPSLELASVSPTAQPCPWTPHCLSLVISSSIPRWGSPLLEPPPSPPLAGHNCVRLVSRYTTRQATLHATAQAAATSVTSTKRSRVSSVFSCQGRLSSPIGSMSNSRAAASQSWCSSMDLASCRHNLVDEDKSRRPRPLTTPYRITTKNNAEIVPRGHMIQLSCDDPKVHITLECHSF